MDLVTGAMASLLPKLAVLLLEEYKLQTGVKKDVKFLQEEMKSISVALCEVASIPRDQLHEQVKIWADQVREVSYEMEDVVDSFLVRVEGSMLTVDSNSFKRLMKKMTNLFKGRQIADVIKDIKSQVQEVAARRDRYKIDYAGNPSTTAATAIDPRMKDLFKDQRELTGINEPRDELIKRLTEGSVDVSNSNQTLKILSIVGFGGLGKTTLAKAIYDKLLLQMKFVHQAFVSVGQKPSVQKVLMDILFKLDKDSYYNAATLDVVQLIGVLRGLLENKRYLIVIDDIWDIESWKNIRCALVDSNCESIIITTTRILKVADGITNFVYKHKPLSDDNSRELFFKRLSIIKGKKSHDQSAKISKKILRKCGGVPLAIITIASLLANKPREDWSRVYDSIGFGHEDNKDVDNTRKILLHSYYDLPCYLRTCLLYLTIYPEDYWIEKSPLIWKWVAEGFVIREEHDGVGLFEIGEGYFNELINRSMIQTVESHSIGPINGCRVHDLVLDIISSLSKEENFVVMMGIDDQHTCPKRNVRRLAVQKRVIDKNDPMNNTPMPQVRSFHATICHVGTMIRLSSFHVLRVLAIERCTFMEDHPYHFEHLGKLLQLRYLGLSNTPIAELPSDIGNLKFLQTLNLWNTNISKLPPSIHLLRQLKCLHLPVCSFSTRDLDRIGNLTSLEELVLGDASVELVKELGKLTELRELQTELHSPNADLFNDLMTSVVNLQKLQRVQVYSGQQLPVECADRKGYMPPHQLRHLYLDGVVFQGLPAWVDPSRLLHLTHLKLEVETVEAKDMEILGSFPELISLRLRIENHVTFSDIVGPGAFPKLRHLEIPKMLIFQKGAMPCLEYLSYDIHQRSISHDGFDSFSLCFPEYDKFPSADVGTIRNLPCLQELVVTIYSDYDMANDMKSVVEIYPKRPTLKITQLPGL